MQGIIAGGAGCTKGGGTAGAIVWGTAALAACLADKGLTGDMFELARQCGVNMVPPAPPTPPTQCAQMTSLAEYRTCCSGVAARCAAECVGVDGADGACISLDRCKQNGQTSGTCFDRCVENMSK